MNKTGLVAFLLILNINAFFVAGNAFAIDCPAPLLHKTPLAFVINGKLPLPEMEIIQAQTSTVFYTGKRFQQNDNIHGCSAQHLYSCQLAVKNYLTQNDHLFAKRYLAYIHPSHNFW